MGKRSTTELFIGKVKIIHNNYYDYSNVCYIHNKEKVEIICPLHGLFLQTPANHLVGQGCPKCAYNIGPQKQALSVGKFINNATKVHGKLYDYSSVKYINNSNKVEIKCFKHGSFWQSPKNHVYRKSGCPICKGEQCSKRQKISFDDFIKEANLIHNNFYYYFPESFIDFRNKVKIRCPNHGIFFQTPDCHISRKHRCPVCSMSSVSREEIQWLDSFCNLNIIKQYRINLPTGKYVFVDGYDPTTNTIYEYHGKYWHGHPDKGDPDEIHPNGDFYGNRYLDTLVKEIRLKNLGYKLISVWK